MKKISNIAIEILVILAFVGSIVLTPTILRAGGNPWSYISFWGILLLLFQMTRLHSLILTWIELLLCIGAFISDIVFCYNGELKLTTLVIHACIYAGVGWWSSIVIKSYGNKWGDVKVVGIVLKCILWVIILLALMYGCGFFSMMTPRLRYYEDLSLSEYEEQSGRTDYFPKTAHNIWYSGSSIGMGGRAYLLKFEAPLEDLYAFGKERYGRLVKQLYNDPSDYPPDDFVPITEPLNDPRPFLSKGYKLKNLDWFDYEEMTNGVTIPEPRSHLPTIWIDLDRNVLYLHWTD